MGDDDDGLPVFLQTADDLKQLLCFLGRQNSSRFVKNQQFGSMVQCLQNLCSLLGSDRQLAYHLHGIDLQSVHFGELPYPIRRSLTLKNSKFHRFISHHNVFGHCQMVHQHKMLVNHLDPKRDRRFRGLHGYFFSLEINLAGLRLVQTIDDLHEGGFSGTIFP